MASPSIASTDALSGVRVGFRLAALVGAAAVAVPLHYLWKLAGRPSPWPRRFLGTVAWLCGARARVIGKPLRRDVFFVCNHLSWMDIPILAGATGSAFVATAELRQAPVVGWLCTLNGTIFVRRGDRMNVAAQIADIGRALTEGWAVTIFPEGTTSAGGTLLPFKAALLQVLDPAPPGVRVQPVVIDYGPDTSRIAWVGDENGRDHARRTLARRGGFPATMRFLEPFDPRDFPGRKAIAAEARRRMETALTGDAPLL